MVERVMEFVLERIHSGEYEQGEQLIARTIAKELDLSVAPVREALHRLSGEGVIELFSNRSARVRRLSIDDILNALEVWEVHAGLTARLVAQRIKIRDNANRVRSAADALFMAAKSGESARYFHDVIRFQKILSEMTENPYIEIVRKRLHTEFWTPQFSSYFPQNLWPEYRENFDRIVNTILSGDADKAEQAYARHVRWAADNLRQSLVSDTQG